MCLVSASVCNAPFAFPTRARERDTAAPLKPAGCPPESRVLHRAAHAPPGAFRPWLFSKDSRASFLHLDYTAQMHISFTSSEIRGFWPTGSAEP